MVSAPMPHEEQLNYGKWTEDAAGLPCFDLSLETTQCIDAPFRHLIGTGRVSAQADRWGNVNLFTTEGGFLWLNSPDSAHARSSLSLMMEVGGEWASLLYSELDTKGQIRIGVGYIEYCGEAVIRGNRFRIVQQVFSPPSRETFIGGRFLITQLDGDNCAARVEVRCDARPSKINESCCTVEERAFSRAQGLAVFTSIDEQLGSVFLLGDESWEASSIRSSLRLGREVTFAAGKHFVVECATGYGNPPSSLPDFEESQRMWKERLAPYWVNAPESWMEQECLWNAWQMLSFGSLDTSTNEYFLAQGGYVWSAFPVREMGTSIALAECDRDLAESCLRFMAKTQLANGDVPKVHNMRRDRFSRDFDSDTELWFVLGCGEMVSLTGNAGFLDQECEFWDEGKASIWEHIRRAFYWVRDEVGRGSHGLILIREGDWNDYLSLMGIGGRGESVMNSGMACRAFDHVADLARKRGEAKFAREVEKYAGELRRAVQDSFSKAWFLRGYTDEGRPVGDYSDDRLFLNAQTWAALGRCGTREQRRKALRSAIEKCGTRIGLTLMSRPYTSPAPDDISFCAIPMGEGENAGIWPQTIHWMVWALAEEGMLDEALEQWQGGTLRNHARKFPEVPFGIFNGPDCFSSRWSGIREGWTQVQLIDRSRFVPILPAVAWQGFAMRRINRAASAALHQEETAISMPESVMTVPA